MFILDSARDDPELVEASRFDGGFVDQHHRDVVLDRVDPMAGLALQCRAALDEFDRRLTVRAREDFEQFRVDRHGPPETAS